MKRNSNFSCKAMKLFLSFALLSSVMLPVCAYEADTLRSVVTDNVVITGTRNETDIRHLPMTITTIGHDVLEENFRPSVLPTVTERVPGLFITSRGVMGYGVSTGAAGSIKVRGIGSGADFLVLVDGLPQYAGLMGHPIPDAYQTMTAERVEVLRGPASVLYGSNAMGGVLNLVTRKMDTDGLRTSVNASAGSYGTVQGEILSRMKSGRFSGMVGLSYGSTDGHRENSEFEQFTGFVKLGYELSDKWALQGNANVTYFDASNPGEVSNPYIDNDSEITRGMASVALTNDYGKTSGALSAFYSWGHHHINDGYHPGGTPQTRLYLHDDLMAGVSLYQSAMLFPGNRTTVGFDWQHFGGEAWNRVIATGEHLGLADKEEDEFAGYVDFRQNITEWLSLDAGLRVDHHSRVGTELVPQGGLAFHLSEGAELKAMVSKGFRNPTLRELYMFRPANPELSPERVMNYEIGYSQRLLENALKFSANVFYLKGDNLISTQMVDGSMLNVNTGEVENWGIEVDAAYNLNDSWSLDANYSFLHMDNPVVCAPEHKVFVGANYSYKRFAAVAGLQYVGGMYIATGTNEHKEDYFLLNLTASYRVMPELRVFVRGENLLAQRYETYLGFPMPKATFTGGVSIDF